MKAIRNDAETLRESANERYVRTVEQRRSHVLRGAAKITAVIVSIVLLCAAAVFLNA